MKRRPLPKNSTAASHKLKPTRDTKVKHGLVCSSVEIKEGAQVSGRRMDELITVLTSRGRRAAVPLHHPALTAAGQLQCRDRTRGRGVGGVTGALPLTTRHLSSLPRWQSCQSHVEVVPQQLSQLARNVSAMCSSSRGKAVNLIRLSHETGFSHELNNISVTLLLSEI